MTQTPNDGGPAFPCSNEQFTYGNPQAGDAHAGMTLRDWFAGQALAGGISGDNSEDYTIDEMASDAYRIADAMLAARSK
jgi:hypothetical protein